MINKQTSYRLDEAIEMIRYAQLDHSSRLQINLASAIRKLQNAAELQRTADYDQSIAPLTRWDVFQNDREQQRKREESLSQAQRRSFKPNRPHLDLDLIEQPNRVNALVHGAIQHLTGRVR